MPATTKPRRRKSLSDYKRDARPDTLDFRDLMYVPTLVDVPTERPLAEYRKTGVPILDQGREGACTGFGLATVIHYLLRTRRIVRDTGRVSPAMLYAIAKRYDEWPGEDYEGSSARGAMKGWHKHGVCGFDVWKPSGKGKLANVLTDERAVDARQRSLGAYFRVNHKDLVAMHAALAEVGILYATASVHAGWDAVGRDGRIPFETRDEGGHAFAIVGYDCDGFWIQNSWGDDWGFHGFCHVRYDDWLVNGTDVWVARLGVPVTLAVGEASAARSAMAARGSSTTWNDLRPHVVSLGNDGRLRREGTYGTGKDDVEAIVGSDFPRLTKGWKKKRLLLYAHGGLTSESGALQRLADVREVLLDAEVYPLAFVWKTDYWTTLTNALRDATQKRRPEGMLDAAKDFMLDRLDDMLEPIARTLTGKLEWDEMKENALAATTERDGGARLIAGLVAALQKRSGVELHVVGHSAGSILHAPLVALLTATGRIAKGPLAGSQGLAATIETCTMWAPACTTALFKEYYLPAVTAGRLRRFALFTLTDQAEQDDNCGGIYHKSLLYLVSHAFEDEPRIPLTSKQGEPLLGMEHWIANDPALARLFGGANPSIDWVKAPNEAPVGNPGASTSRRHGDFDDDAPTVQATLARILGRHAAPTKLHFEASASSRRDRRRALASAT
jgi:Papain family cysteine protease